MRLLASPVIGAADQQAIRDAVETPQEVLERITMQVFASARDSEEALVRHHYDCLAYLIACGRLQLRLVLMRSSGIFHPKVWLFHDGLDHLAVHGSSNATTPGLLYNFETVRLERPWRSSDDEASLSTFVAQFERVWDGKDRHTAVFDLPEALRLDLMRDGETRPPPSLAQFMELWRKAEAVASVKPALIVNPKTHPRLTIPEGLAWETGAFAHQGAAVHAWEGAGGRGVLAMATGAGKTISALICATRQMTLQTPLLVVISAPYRPLVDQWLDEVRAFRIAP